MYGFCPLLHYYNIDVETFGQCYNVTMVWVGVLPFYFVSPNVAFHRQIANFVGFFSSV